MKKLITKLLVLTILLGSVGCTPKRQLISYTVYPVGFLLDRIVMDEGDIESIQENTIVQKTTLKSNYKSTLENSYLFFHIGDLEPYFATNQEDINETGVNQIDLSNLNTIYKFQRYTRVLVDHHETFVEGPYYEGKEFNLVDIDDRDLFLWTDPIGMVSMGNTITDYLASNYVEKASIFKDNFNKLRFELYRLDEQFRDLATKNLEENKEIKFVSMTGSFNSWQKNYGFQTYPVMLSKYGALPTDEQLDVIKNKIIKDKVKYIAYEPNMTQDMIDLFGKLVDELGLQRVNLSNLSSLNETQIESGQNYLTIMYENLATLENMTESLDDEVTEEIKDETKEELENNKDSEEKKDE